MLLGFTASIPLQRTVSGTPVMLSRWFSSPTAAMRRFRQHPEALIGLVKPAATRKSTSTSATWASRDGGPPKNVLRAGDKPQQKASFKRLGSTTQTPKFFHGSIARRFPVSSRMALGRWERTGGKATTPSSSRVLCSASSGDSPGDWRPFDEARDYVKSLGIKSSKEWQDWSKSGQRPPDIPSDPDQVYKEEGWQSWGDFLGYRPGYVAGEWRSFDTARDYVRSLGLKSKSEWEEWRRSGERPPDIPSSPDRVYKDEGWLSYGDFLGYSNEGNVAGEWRSFEEARDYARSLGFKSQKEWHEWIKSGERPQDVPSRPDQVYKEKGWKSWGDFLGFNPGNAPGEWRPFEEARAFVRGLGLQSKSEWNESRKSEERPLDVPSRPELVYKDKGWMSWGDFLGYNKGYVVNKWRSFEEAWDYVKSLCLKSKEEWQEWRKTNERPPDIPACPDRVYKEEGWLSWADFLGYTPGYVARASSQ